VSDQPDDYGGVTSRYYDAAYAALRGPSGDADWYLTLARASAGPVLELGVGTGRVMLPIAAEGLACTGLDPSPGMLDVLRGKNPPDNLRLAQGRMQDFDLGGDRFALIFAAFRVFQHLYTVEDQIACLTAVRRHLVPGGAFAFDVFVPSLARTAILEEPETEDVRFADGGDEIVRYTAVRRNHPEQLMQVRMRYERRRRGKAISDDVVEFSMRYFHRYELHHLLKRAGLGRIELCGDFHGRPFGEDATSFVIVARPEDD
jgi:SAM-dependent methyltransferase